MIERLFSPLQRFHHWLEEHPGIHNAWGLFLLIAAALFPWPGWVLDLWIAIAWGVSCALTALLLLVGSELEPREALRTLPGFLRRLTLHRLALSLAITKAILLGSSAGAIIDGVAQQGLRGHAGIGVAALGMVLVAYFACGRTSSQARLTEAQRVIDAAIVRLELDRTGGVVPPRQAKQREQALRDDLLILSQGAEVTRLLRSDAWLAVSGVTVVLTAGLITGLAFKGWPLALTLAAYTTASAAEQLTTLLPAVIFGAILSHWLVTALESIAETVSQSASSVAGYDSVSNLTIETGKELAANRRLIAEASQALRARVGREFGLPLGRIEFVSASQLDPRGYRIVVRGVTWSSGDLEAAAGANELAEVTFRCVQSRAGDLLTMEIVREWLNEVAETHPATVAETLSRFGWVGLHGLLQSLLREQVPLRDLVSVLEAAWASGDASTPADTLLEGVRRRLGLLISLSLADENGTISIYQLSREWLASLDCDEPPPWLMRDLAQATGAALNASRIESWGRVAILVPQTMRMRVAAAVQQTHPDLAVVCAEELSPHYGLRVLGTIEPRIKDLPTSPITILKMSNV
ncbi:MAG: FHIPEP family type III secretion protein [Candidatus Sericytochromatia bacterium]|nr:FHIPEP family type III secretion protein [Candidatus Sericytochromatia bacterium]